MCILGFPVLGPVQGAGDMGSRIDCFCLSGTCDLLGKTNKQYTVKTGAIKNHLFKNVITF